MDPVVATPAASWRAASPLSATGSMAALASANSITQTAKVCMCSSKKTCHGRAVRSRGRNRAGWSRLASMRPGRIISSEATAGAVMAAARRNTAWRDIR
jgi:hypothetical protein